MMLTECLLDIPSYWEARPGLDRLYKPTSGRLSNGPEVTPMMERKDMYMCIFIIFLISELCRMLIFTSAEYFLYKLY